MADVIAMENVQIWRHDSFYDDCERLHLRADAWETQPGAAWVWVVDTEDGPDACFDAFLVGKERLAALLKRAEQQARDPELIWDDIAQLSPAMEYVTVPAWR